MLPCHRALLYDVSLVACGENVAIVRVSVHLALGCVIRREFVTGYLHEESITDITNHEFFVSCSLCAFSVCEPSLEHQPIILFSHSFLQ